MVPKPGEEIVGYEIRTGYLDCALWVVRSLDELRALVRRGVPRSHVFTFTEAYFLLDAAKTEVYSLAEAVSVMASELPIEEPATMWA
jgi:hypothetical protein